MALTVDPVDPARFTGAFALAEGSGEGAGSFALAAVDAYGNDQSSLTNPDLAVDGERPTVAIVTVPGSPVRGGDVAVTVTASEPLSAEPTLVFTDAGGAALNYIPSLNARDDHVEFLTALVAEHAQGWPEAAQ